MLPLLLLLGATAANAFGPSVLCTNTCWFKNDGECDDGGLGSDYSICGLGTDCNDCGARGNSQYSILCTNACHFKNDGECDDGGPGSDYDICGLGTDCNDCGPRGSSQYSPPCNLSLLTSHVAGGSWNVAGSIQSGTSATFTAYDGYTCINDGLRTCSSGNLDAVPSCSLDGFQLFGDGFCTVDTGFTSWEAEIAASFVRSTANGYTEDELIGRCAKDALLNGARGFTLRKDDRNKYYCHIHLKRKPFTSYYINCGLIITNRHPNCPISSFGTTDWSYYGYKGYGPIVGTYTKSDVFNQKNGKSVCYKEIPPPTKAPVNISHSTRYGRGLGSG